MKLINTITLLLILSQNTWASDAHHDAGIPWKTIGYQAFNTTVLFVLLIYFLKNPIKGFFAAKRQNFVAAAEKATIVRRAAEQEQQDISVKLSKLESTADESISRARAEAADLRKQLLVDAELMAKRIEQEASAIAALEVEKAKNSLRAQLIKESVEAGRAQIKEKVNGEDHKRLQGDFINNIQAVQ